MKYKEARELLKKAINEQQTIKTSKLKDIVISMGISLKKDQNGEVALLQRELKVAREQLEGLEHLKEWAFEKGYVLPTIKKEKIATKFKMDAQGNLTRVYD